MPDQLTNQNVQPHQLPIKQTVSLSYPFTNLFRQRIYYGWYVVATCWIALFFGYGVMLYSYLLFFDSWTTDFGWSRGILSGSYSAGILSLAASAPIVGKLADRYGSRSSMVVGSILMGAGVFSLRWIEEPWHLYAAFILACVGFAASSVVPVSILTARWFERRRGLAVGITYTGLGAGGVIGAPVANTLIERLGWESTVTILALAIWVAVVPTTLLIIRSDPYSMGMLPDGSGPRRSEGRGSKRAVASHRHLPGLTLTQALGTARFWMVAFLFVIALASSFGTFSQIQPFLLDLGYSKGLIAFIYSFNGGAALVAKFFYGFLSDKVPVKAILVVATLGALIAPVSILLINTLDAPRWLALIMAIAIGIAGSAFSTLVPVVTAISFGLRNAGAIAGALGSSVLLGMAIGPLFMGAIFVVTNSYTIQATVFLGAMIAALLALLTGPSLHYQLRGGGQDSRSF